MSAFNTKSPVDGTELDPVDATPVSEVPNLVARARTAQRGWAEQPVEKRIRAVARVKDRVLDRAEALGSLLHREVGKPEVEAILGEVLPTADVVDWWCTSIEELLDASEVELDRLTYPGKRGTIYREPRGTIAVIMPWNFPVALPLRTIVPALLAGNAVLFKPSEVAPRSGALVGALFEGLLPDGVLTVVQGAGDIGAALCEADVDLVVFTGSVATGRAVAKACAERLRMCSLELGGKDAAIVLADANLDRAANGIAWGALTNAGQNCAAIERVYVEKPIADAFVGKLEKAVGALRVGDDVGPLTTEAQRETVERHVADAKEKGGVVLCGGQRGDRGFSYRPTIVKVTTDDSDLMRKETFGPVIGVRVVDSEDEAVELANASPYGLTASVWTRKVRRGEQLAGRLQAGVVTINNHAFTGALPAAPWSGRGDTGYGITGSPLALGALTRPRFVLVDRSRAKRELWWYPYTPVLRTIALSMAALRSANTSLLGKLRAIVRLLVAFPRRLGGG